MYKMILLLADINYQRYVQRWKQRYGTFTEPLILHEKKTKQFFYFVVG